MYQITSHDGGKKFKPYGTTAPRGPVNLSNIKEMGNKGFSVIEPRIYATPGTIKPKKDLPPATPDDIQNGMVYFIAYGTTYNPHANSEGENHALEGQPTGTQVPQDLFYSFTTNYGESFYCEDNRLGNCTHPAIKQGHGHGGSFYGAQIRCNPAGTELYAVYVADVESSTDVDTSDGSGPCQGSGKAGNDVCFNSTQRSEVFDERPSKFAHLCGDVNKVSSELFSFCDMNGDGKITGADQKLFEAAVVQWDIHNK